MVIRLAQLFFLFTAGLALVVSCTVPDPQTEDPPIQASPIQVSPVRVSSEQAPPVQVSPAQVSPVQASPEQLPAGKPPLKKLPSKKPQRIISLDFCADQYALKFADKDQILALSPDATAAFSYMRQSAQGIPAIRPITEDILAHAPDLVIRSYGGGPRVAYFLERAGIPVLTIGASSTIDDVIDTSLRVANALGQPERGKSVTTQMKRRLAAVLKNNGAPGIRKSDPENLLYMTPGGVTSGPGSLIHEMIVAAGLENFEKSPGWRSIPLERLVHARPDMVATSYFDTHLDDRNPWNTLRHPIAREQLRAAPLIDLPGALTACGGWFLVDAVEILAQAR